MKCKLTRLRISPVRREPLVWVRRLAFFASIQDKKPVRDIPLQRGLNIIWARDQEEDSAAFRASAAGHGAGKTTFCRFIRFCLGEDAFGNKRNQDRIRDTLADAYVGAEVLLDGTLWAVVRPFSSHRASFALKDASIEQAIAKRPSRDSYDLFRTELQNLVLRPLESRAIPGVSDLIDWNHALGVSSRDQECRFESLWQWRSSRAGEGQKLAKAASMFVIRALLGLVSAKQSDLEQELALASGGLEDSKKKVVRFLEKADMYCKDLERQLLARLTEIAPPQPQPVGEYNPAELLGTGLELTIQTGMTGLAGKQMGLNESIQKLNAKINDLSGRIASLRRNRDFQASLLPKADVGLAEVQQVGAEAAGEKKRLDDAIANEICDYAQIKIAECSYVQDRRRQLARGTFSDAHLAEQDETRRNREIEAVKALIAKLDTEIKATENSREGFENERTALYDARRDWAVKKQQLQDNFNALKHWRNVTAGSETDPEWDGLKAEEARFQSKISSCRKALEKEHAERQKALAEFRRLYNECIQEVLGSGYRGDIQEKDGELELLLSSRAAVVSGEALDTLSIVLGDISAQLACLSGKGCLPGLIIHDSPREADMAPSIYRSFLHFALALHNEFPKDEAPFQYIVTTTSAPPKELQGNDITKLKLDANKEKQMLLRVNYGIPALPLFDNV